MTATPAPSRSLPLLLALAAAALGFGFAGFGWWRHADRLAAVEQQLTANSATLGEILGEVTRVRIEQSADGKGPAALLEKLSVYAPLVSNSRVAEPDYQNARKEIDAILRAFESLGRDAWDPIVARLEQLDPRDDHDEISRLLEAAVRVDAQRGERLLQDVLLGVEMPAPRLRWFAARVLTERNLPLARQLLRRILLTESYRGVNAERAAAGGLPIPDMAAVANTGFNNFVVAYVRTDDPDLEDTLLQVLGRVEHDAITIQECVEALGRLRSTRAVERIEQLYRDPPLQQQNPIFLARCLDALVEIQRAEARPFLERMLPDASSEITAKHIQFLLQKIERNDFGSSGGPAAPIQAGK